MLQEYEQNNQNLNQEVTQLKSEIQAKSDKISELETDKKS